MQFLVNLNREYDSVELQILSIDPLPILEMAHYLVSQVETHKQINNYVSTTYAFMA